MWSCNVSSALFSAVYVYITRPMKIGWSNLLSDIQMPGPVLLLISMFKTIFCHFISEKSFIQTHVENIEMFVLMTANFLTSAGYIKWFWEMNTTHFHSKYFFLLNTEMRFYVPNQNLNSSILSSMYILSVLLSTYWNSLTDFSVIQWQCTDLTDFSTSSNFSMLCSWVRTLIYLCWCAGLIAFSCDQKSWRYVT